MTSILYFSLQDKIVSYGDAESHLNIAKRVVHSITPGFAQLGGIWLPLPHLLMVPFVYFDTLWRTGLAGSIVSGYAYVISCLFLYKTGFLLTKNRSASFIAFILFAINPNILYMQATPMTELLLIAFFILSSYFFLSFLLRGNDVLHLIYASFFGLCATLSRYDGWFLVLVETVLLIIYLLRRGYSRKVIEGLTIVFIVVAFFGIALWMTWDYLILGDPFYFKNSQFSAQAQQQVWHARGELPTYRNIFLSFSYFTYTTLVNSGLVTFVLAVIGLLVFVCKRKRALKFSIALLLLVPFVFNVFTLYMGQSIIFIPDLTPSTYEWNMFNVRYGLMMIPAAALFIGYLFYQSSPFRKLIVSLLLVLQGFLFTSGISKVITYEDGTKGLSSAKRPDAETWLAQHYDGGLVLIDDFSRSLSIIRSTIPMTNIIYVGNKPYWEESLREPEKYAQWIVIHGNDDVWRNVLQNPQTEARLYTHFQRVYTSPQIVIFRRADESLAARNPN